MKTAYYVMGNVWLIIALILQLGRFPARESPTMYSFFGMSGWRYPSDYNLMIGIAVFAAVVQFVLAMKAGRKSP
jgi:hypothetical protein